jgi:hypothetical protein
MPMVILPRNRRSRQENRDNKKGRLNRVEKG